MADFEVLVKKKENGPVSTYQIATDYAMREAIELADKIMENGHYYSVMLRQMSKPMGAPYAYVNCQAAGPRRDTLQTPKTMLELSAARNAQSSEMGGGLLLEPQ